MDTALPASRFTFRTFGVSWPLIVAMFLIVGLFVHPRSAALLNDPDTYWHLTAGQWIVDHMAVPLADPFSHSMPGAAWTPHEWLSELLLLGAYKSGGWAALVVFPTLAFAATMAYLMRFLLERMEPAHALLFTALTAGMMLSHLMARPHVLAWPVLAIWVGTLINASERHRQPPWLLLPLMVVWANLHGSFTLGLAFACALALDAVLAVPRAERKAAALRWAGFVGLALAASLLTPSGWQGLLYTAQVMNMTLTLDVIEEWRSPDFHKPQMLEFWLMLMLAIACSGRMHLPWLRLVLVMGLLHLALKQQRQVAVLGLLSAMLMATALAERWRATRGAAPDAERIDQAFRALAAPARLGAVAACALAVTLMAGVIIQSGQMQPAELNTPKLALAAAQKAGATGPVFNAYNFGGYLIHRHVPVFIDGRSDMYGDALMRRMVDATTLQEPEELPRLLADYRIGWTLLQPGTPAIAALDLMPGWRRVYADAIAVVHVRDAGVAR